MNTHFNHSHETGKAVGAHTFQDRAGETHPFNETSLLSKALEDIFGNEWQALLHCCAFIQYFEQHVFA